MNNKVSGYIDAYTNSLREGIYIKKAINAFPGMHNIYLVYFNIRRNK